ncbi:MAG: DapH/DapD/GlmU-related protein, partial [Alphaproteobacteria bacterium]
RLFDLLDRVGNDNAKNEYYLTDIVALARAEGLGCAVVEGDAADLVGIDSRADLAAVEARVQQRLRRAAMEAGVTMIDPESVFLSYDTAFGRDVMIEPNVVFGPGVIVGDDVRIRAFSHIEGATIATGAAVGPFARLRPGADIGAEARVGNFVEVKNATIEQGAKVNHLSYVGDSRVGAKANVGAGTITCNYDGFTKAHTDIGAGAFIGSNTALVAPVKVGDGASIGAGSVITKDVPADALALTRAPQDTRKGVAARMRTRKQAAKDKRKRKKG